MVFCFIHNDFWRKPLIFKNKLKDVAKITQGIGKKLNTSEARASISLHKVAQKNKPEIALLRGFN